MSRLLCWGVTCLARTRPPSHLRLPPRHHPGWTGAGPGGVRHNTQHRVILLPEYPAHKPDNNPAVRSYADGLPDWVGLTEAHCYYGLGQRLMEFESAVCRMEADIEAGEVSLEKLWSELETARLELENMLGMVAVLEIATDKLDLDRFRQLTRRAERAFLTRYDSRVVHGFLTGDSVASGLQEEDRTVLDRAITEYKHQGYDLPEKKYRELNSNWMKRLGEAQRDHRFKLTTATQRFRHVVRDPAVVREFPPDLLRAMCSDSSQPARGPWAVSLHPYIYRKFMEYCPDRRLRWNAFTAQTSRGSSSMDHYLNCAGHVKDIRQHRLDQALLLGYHNYADMSMVTKMAGSVDNVQTLLAALLGPARTAQESELDSLQRYAESRGFEDNIREFDIGFFRRKQIRTEYGVEEEAMRDYFPLPAVLAALQSLLKTHFQVELVEVEDGAELWSPEVRLYRVLDEGKEVGHCYLDPYIRDDKAYQGGDRGWYIPVRPGSEVGGSRPVGVMVLALPQPGFGKPSLLSPAEVEEVTRQAGKLLQHVLARRRWAEISGRTVEWDCLAVVPELLTHWLQQPDSLQQFSQHWSTGEQLSPAQVTSLISARSHMPGYSLCNELYRAAYDIAFYTEDYEDEQFSDLAARLASQYLVLEREKEDAFPLYFDEMLTGHWAAGYYSHLWSRMLAADIFSAYTEAGLHNTEALLKVSARLKSTLLTAGSSRPTAETFREFRGRDPTPEALLLSLGLSQPVQPRVKARMPLEM